MTPIQSVLFDLDGTLLDTAPDMATALNLLRETHQLPPLPLAAIRPHVAHGARALLKIGMYVDEAHPNYTRLLEKFLSLYHQQLTAQTLPFPKIDQVLSHLESKRLPWGIVTNKPSRFTFDLLKHLDLAHRAACIICGDSLSKRKPDPDQILHACDLLKINPADCLYVGDTITDVIASKAAGTQSVVALYGYVSENEDPYAWMADGYIDQPIDLIAWIKNRELS